MRKLEELGYKDEDLDPRFDIAEKNWKWNQLINQTRALTERGQSSLCYFSSYYVPDHQFLTSVA